MSVDSSGKSISSAPALVAVCDFEAAAKEKLPVPAWVYFNGGSADEITLRRNREALDALVVGGVSKEAAKLAVQLIAKGQIPNVRISY